MARLALLAILMCWMSWSKGLGAGDPADLRPTVAIAIFFGGYALLIFGLRCWGHLAGRRAQEGSSRALHRFHQAMNIARLIVPAWLGVGIYCLNWGSIVQSVVPWLYRWPSAAMHLECPQVILGTLPAMLAWMGLWWSQFPAERLLREQTVLVNLNDDLPVHAPPTFRDTIGANFRLQVLFTLLPVFLILLLRDVTVLVLALANVRDAKGVENWVMGPAMMAVFLFAPELLRRALRTERLADSPLRRRLEAMCHEAKLGYREILLWRTDHSMGNAAVMGLFPRVRYVLLSDLLLETMTDQQIEAVFAHELGHVVHKHLWWFGLFAIIAMLFMIGPGEQLMVHARHWYVDLHHHSMDSWNRIEGLVGSVLFFGSFVLAFGFLSPRFERQADVYAARTMQKDSAAIAQKGMEPPKPQAEAVGDAPGSSMTLAYEPASHVGEYGAGIFAAALYRVAVINNMPVSARNWSHGSISQRMRALHEMSADPARTGRFDRRMTCLYAGLIVCLCVFGAWAFIQSRDPSVISPAAGMRISVPSQTISPGR